MNDNYELTFYLESRYGDEIAPEDKAELCRKIAEYAKLIIEENNGQSKHLGLHFRMVDYDVKLNSVSTT